MDTPTLPTLPPFIPRKPIRYRPRAAGAPLASPPLALVLVSASYDPDGPEVYLTFDRDIDIAGLDVAAFVVADGPDGNRMQGFESPSLLAPDEAQVLMERIGAASGPDVLLTVAAGNGIGAVDDGGTWGGCDALALPFGE